MDLAKKKLEKKRNKNYTTKMTRILTLFHSHYKWLLAETRPTLQLTKIAFLKIVLDFVNFGFGQK